MDTSAFISFLDKSDSYHALFARLFASPPRLITSALVVAEGHGWFLRRYDSRRAIQFLGFLDDLTVLRVQPVGTTEIAAAARLLRQFQDQSLTLADALGLLLMKEEGIRTCWSTDVHLGLTGVPLAIHSSS